jgi:hypothetical protein
MDSVVVVRRCAAMARAPPSSAMLDVHRERERQWLSKEEEPARRDKRGKKKRKKEKERKEKKGKGKGKRKERKQGKKKKKKELHDLFSRNCNSKIILFKLFWIMKIENNSYIN